MSNYSSTATCRWRRDADAADESSQHGIGSDIMPAAGAADGAAHVYDFLANKVPGSSGPDHGYWREVGTLDSYFAAHMDLCTVHPVFSLYNDRWPILTSSARPRKYP